MNIPIHTSPFAGRLLINVRNKKRALNDIRHIPQHLKYHTFILLSIQYKTHAQLDCSELH